MKWIRYLPCSGIVTEVAERVLEPGVDFVERQLSLWRFDNRLADERGVREGWADIRVTIELAIALQLYIVQI